MIVTREMDYAIRILRALHQGRPKALTATEIMEREHLKQAITYKLMKKLTKAGFVQGRRGQVGGYQLQKDCSEITFYNLFLSIEGPLYLTECLEKDYCCDNNSCGECRVHREFLRIQKAFDLELQKTTLDQLF